MPGPPSDQSAPGSSTNRSRPPEPAAWTTRARAPELSTAKPGFQLRVCRAPGPRRGRTRCRSEYWGRASERTWPLGVQPPPAVTGPIERPARAQHEQQPAAHPLSGLQRPTESASPDHPAALAYRQPTTTVSPVPQQPAVTTTASTRRPPAQAVAANDAAASNPDLPQRPQPGAGQTGATRHPPGRPQHQPRPVRGKAPSQRLALDPSWRRTRRPVSGRAASPSRDEPG